MGPATGLPALNLRGAPVTVAGLCRIHTGFADPKAFFQLTGRVYSVHTSAGVDAIGG